MTGRECPAEARRGVHGTRAGRFILEWRRPAAAVLAVLCLFSFGYAGGSRSSTGGPRPGDEVGYFTTRHPVRTPYEVLLACQLPSGAFTLKPGDSRIIPYFANLAAMALVDRRPQAVRLYVEWYLDRLNLPDRWGLHGTIYDYRVDPSGKEEPTHGYDSADSYAATFLTLVRAYLDRTGDLDFVLDKLPALETVAGVIPALQDADGLVWATPARLEKYLMDNCENYRGLVDYAAILAAVGRDEEAGRALAAAGRVRRGIEERLWNEKRGNYDWCIYTLWLGGLRLGEVSRKSDWKRWYPDTTAQIFPVITGVIDPGSPRAASLYQNLDQWHPGWVGQAKADPHPWSVLGYAAAVMGDTQQALAFTRATAATYMAEDGPYSGLSWEIAWHLLTVGLLVGHDVPQAAGGPSLKALEETGPDVTAVSASGAPEPGGPSDPPAPRPAR